MKLYNLISICDQTIPGRFQLIFKYAKMISWYTLWTNQKSNWCWDHVKLQSYGQIIWTTTAVRWCLRQSSFIKHKDFEKLITWRCCLVNNELQTFQSLERDSNDQDQITESIQAPLSPVKFCIPCFMHGVGTAWTVCKVGCVGMIPKIARGSLAK